MFNNANWHFFYLLIKIIKNKFVQISYVNLKYYFKQSIIVHKNAIKKDTNIR